jgi:hypothetical protein
VPICCIVTGTDLLPGEWWYANIQGHRNFINHQSVNARPSAQWASFSMGEFYIPYIICSSAPDCCPINRVKNALERTVSLDEICLKIVWLDRHTVDEDMRHWT